VCRSEVLGYPHKAGPLVPAHAKIEACEAHALPVFSVCKKRPLPPPPRGGNQGITKNLGKPILGKGIWSHGRGNTCIRLVFRDIVHW